MLFPTVAELGSYILSPRDLTVLILVHGSRSECCHCRQCPLTGLTESMCDMITHSEGVLDIATYTCVLQLDILCLGINSRVNQPGSYRIHITE